jgi:signal transduction histidine kinase
VPPVAATLRRARAGARRVDVGARTGRPTLVQTLVTLAFLAVMATTASVRTGVFLLPDTALALAVLGSWAPLLLRTYRPVLALVGTVVGESMILIFLAVPDRVSDATAGMGAYQPAPLATMLAVWTVASRTPPRVGWIAGVGAGGTLATLGVVLRSSDTYLTDLVLFYLVMTAAALGVWWSARRERAIRTTREREEHARQAVLDERLRIARELHDVLAHNLTLVNAQAGVARFLLRSDVDAAETALRDITGHTARAIDELRSTIGLLRSTGPAADTDDTPEDTALRPVPGLGTLDELLAGFATAGTEVEASTTGDPRPLAPQVDLAAYRIVQESVTNAAKHARGAPVTIALTWSAEGVRLRIANPAPATADPLAVPRMPGTGNGLIGMRERAAAAGGAMRAGPLPDGGFEVVATLPAESAEPPDPADPAGPPEGDPR